MCSSHFFFVVVYNQSKTVISSSASSVNFINILRAAFACADPKSAKKTDNLTVFFLLSISGRVKAVHGMLMKLTPVVSKKATKIICDTGRGVINKGSILSTSYEQLLDQ